MQKTEYMPLDNLAEWKHHAYRTLRKAIDRRDFLRGGANVLAGATLLGALGKIFGGSLAAASGLPGNGSRAVKTGTFFFPRLRFDEVSGNQEWNVYPSADVNLRRALANMTNINVSQEPVVASLNDFENLRNYPFVFATEQKEFKFPRNEERNLREFLMRGGFVFGDDCVLGNRGDIFFQTFRAMMNRIYPDNPMRQVPNDHEIFHCFFEFPRGLPHLQGVPHGLWATFDKDTERLLTVLSPSDLHCGWVLEPSWFPLELSQEAIKMSINIVIYYLTH